MKSVAHHGAARVSDLCLHAPRTLGRAGGRYLVRQVLQTRADIRWLDESGEWFWLTAVPRNRVVIRVQKVLALHPRIALSMLHRAISRDYKPVNIPEAILRSLCSHVPWCRVASHHIEAGGLPRLEQLLSGAEAVICGILRGHGGALPLPRLQQLCFATGVKRPNLWRVLSFSPLIQRFDKEIYGLVGAEEAARQVAPPRKRSLPKRRVA
ncbi:MAG: hypothetical protein LAP40_24320 [Acidobacteriia bacterium]|nr:hypothetical protein [Terriglobia bacterium]